jgi:hypothetical protein
VVLSAVPGPGQEFLGWSGDASGGENPLAISMTGDKVIVARFTARPELSVPPGLAGRKPEGFRLFLTGPAGSLYEIQASGSGLGAWSGIGRATNDLGTVQFLDPAASASARFYRAQKLVE